MEIIDARELKKYLLDAKFIGKGRCAFCFLMRNGQVLKIYYPSSFTKNLFGDYDYDMVERFTFLNSFNNQTFYGPVSIFASDKIVAYIMEYADGVRGTKLDPKMPIKKLEELFSILESDMADASRRNLKLSDVKPKNMIIGDNIKIIDLDFCKKMSNMKLIK